MESKFTHYLVTRFNVKIDGYGPEYFPSSVRPVSWEIERLPLFEHYCAPSVAGQRRKNFIWLIYCDIATSPEIIERIHSAVKNTHAVQLLFVRDFQEMIESIRNVCASATTPFVITSRLDNDDGLGLDYVKVVQENFEPRANVILNLLGGINFHIANGVLTYHRNSLGNSFISIIEDPKSLHTIYGFKHSTPPLGAVVKNIECSHAFWMTLHGNNAAMRNSRGWPAWPWLHVHHYAIDPAYIIISHKNTLAYAVKWFPTAFIKKVKFIIRSKFHTP